MLQCEGYKMFKGKADFMPPNPKFATTIHGVWLYKPEYDCWYVNGESFPASFIKNIVED